MVLGVLRSTQPKAANLVEKLSLAVALPMIAITQLVITAAQSCIERTNSGHKQVCQGCMYLQDCRRGLLSEHRREPCCLSKLDSRGIKSVAECVLSASAGQASLATC